MCAMVMLLEAGEAGCLEMRLPYVETIIDMFRCTTINLHIARTAVVATLNAFSSVVWIYSIALCVQC